MGGLGVPHNGTARHGTAPRRVASHLYVHPSTYASVQSMRHMFSTPTCFTAALLISPRLQISPHLRRPSSPTYIYIYIYTISLSLIYMCIYIYVYVYTYMYIGIIHNMSYRCYVMLCYVSYICIYVYIYTYIYIYMYIYIYIYIYIHIVK